MIKSNMFVQEVGVEISQMKQLLEEMQFEVNIYLIRGYPKIRALFNQDPGPHLIIKCNKEVNLIRERIS